MGFCVVMSVTVVTLVIVAFCKMRCCDDCDDCDGEDKKMILSGDDQAEVDQRR